MQKPKRVFAISLTLLLLLLVVSTVFGQEAVAAEEESGGVGAVLPLWSVIPFVGILLSIALFPLLAPHFWHHNFGKVSAFWAVVFALPFIVAYQGEALHEIWHIYLSDYIPFIILLWSLFTVSGGILLEGTLRGTPLVNTMLLLIGTFFASWIGTTGAAMLLIRPLLRANAERQRKVHLIIFFIFLVANIGGSLTPLGDPPLFLGFLHGVPFFWTFRLIVEMGLLASILLVIFFIVDSVLYRVEQRATSEEGERLEGAAVASTPQDARAAKANPGPGGTSEVIPLRIRGGRNFIFLLGVVGGVLMSGLWHGPAVSIFGVEEHVQNLARDAILIIMGLLSVRFTSKAIRDANGFTWFPIKEVAYLFAGIFMTIVPALAILEAGEHGALAWLITAVKEPAHYFWVTGTLSSFLDNAPTYLTFLSSALGTFFPDVVLHSDIQAVHMLIEQKEIYLVAISTGAVFMGANTYIGNAPNFMVKSIAEEQGVKMPSFFGYMMWSVGILVPLFILITLIFFS